MIHHLVVTRPFLTYARGDMIADVAQIGKIMATEYRKFVTQVIIPDSSKG